MLSASCIAMPVSIHKISSGIRPTLVAKIHGRVHSGDIALRALSRHHIGILLVESTYVRVQHLNLKRVVVWCPH